VADKSAATAGQPNVKFKSVAAVLYSEIERGEAILWNGSERTGAPMTEKEGDVGHRGFYCNALITNHCCGLLEISKVGSRYFSRFDTSRDRNP